MNAVHRGAHRWSLGLFFIGAVVLIWTLSSVLVQYIYVSLSFDSPFLLTYLCSILFVLYLPAHFPWAHWCCCGGRAEADGAPAVEFQRLPTATDSDDESDGIVIPSASRPTDDGCSAQRVTKLSAAQTLRAAAVVVLPWFLAQYTYNASLRFTSITSNTVISTSSCLHTFLFSLLFLDERFAWSKVFALLLCLAGALVTCLGDHVNGSGGSGGSSGGGGGAADTLWGDAMCLASAVLYGAYTTALRAVVPDDDAASMTLLFGMIGLLSAVLVGPMVFALHEAAGHHAWLNHRTAAAAELATLPALTAVSLSPLELWRRLASVPTVIVVAVVAKGLFQNVLADYLWARSIVLTSPTVSTMGLSMTIPAAMLADFACGKGLPTAHALGGAALMLAGFFAFNSIMQAEERATAVAAADDAALRKRAGASEVEMPTRAANQEVCAEDEDDRSFGGDEFGTGEDEGFDEIDFDDL